MSTDPTLSLHSHTEEDGNNENHQDTLIENTLGLELFNILHEDDDTESKAIDVNQLRRLVERGADIHTIIPQRGVNVMESILSEWIQSDYDYNNIFPFMEYLILVGLDLDSSRSETSPLIVACASPAKPIADSDYTESRKLRHQRYYNAIQLLLNNGSNIEAREPYNGENALLVAINHEVILSLLDRGADINVANESGQTPLMLACKNLDGTLVELLLNKGADPSLVCHFGWNASKYASYSAFSYHDRSLADPVLALLSQSENTQAITVEDT